MKNLFKIKFIIPVVLPVVLTSCVAHHKYERLADIVDERLYRTDMIQQDSAGLGDLSWREIFTDAVLQNHISEALNNNLDIRIALQNIISAEAYLKQSKAAYFPTVSVGPAYTFNTPSLNTQSGQIVGDRRYLNSFELSGDFSWEADIWGKLSAQERAQMASYLGTAAAHKAVKSDIVAAVASAYYQLLTYDEQKRIISETIKIRNKNLETTKALKDAGTVTEVAVQQSEALVHNAESLLINIDTQLELLENAISLLKGKPSAKVERTTLAQQKIPENTDLGFAAKLLSNRADVMQAEYSLMNAFELTNAAKASFYPNLRITGSGGILSGDIDKLFSANSLFATVIGSLTQPILNKRQIRTQYEVSQATQERAYLNFRKTVLTAGKEVSDALRVYTAQDRFIELKQKELDNYQKSVEYSQQLVNYGMANYLEVLNASVNQLNAELNISNARLAKMQAGVELYRALGGGWK
ncbi:TolC family protein [Chryseobacterium taklimakanense]|uniref:efflux transporter outer membrane subunit n=1 Tax=Chryseobacterium taklimakanense TaxID=536441 RepID=UPI001EF64D93|nr:TolC family protein [Chryseobacterium taklimakanense]MCG7280853.1 TolC family protein [Chryseobacterium taklimakanense]